MTPEYYITMSESSILVRNEVVAFNAATLTDTSLSVKLFPNRVMKESLYLVNCSGVRCTSANTSKTYKEKTLEFVLSD